MGNPGDRCADVLLKDLRVTCGEEEPFVAMCGLPKGHDGSHMASVDVEHEAEVARLTAALAASEAREARMRESLEAAEEDAQEVCNRLRSFRAVIPQNAERALYFIRQARSALSASPAPSGEPPKEKP